MEDRFAVLGEDPFFKDRERGAVDALSPANDRLEQAGNALNYQGGKIFLTKVGNCESLMGADSL